MLHRTFVKCHGAEAFIVQILFKSKANSKEEYKQMLIIYLDARPYCEFGEGSVMDAVFQNHISCIYIY